MFRAVILVSAFGLVAGTAGAGEGGMDTPSFGSPSGNIICYVPDVFASRYGEAKLVCHIFSADWAPPLEEDCNLDRTPTLTLGPEGAPRESIECHGDVFWPVPIPTLSYGSIWSIFGYRCEVARSGVTCTNESGHGFEIARRGRRMF